MKILKLTFYALSCFFVLFLFSCDSSNIPVKEIKYKLYFVFQEPINSYGKIDINDEFLKIAMPIIGKKCKDIVFIPNDAINIYRIDLSNEPFAISTKNCWECDITRTITGETLENSENKIKTSLERSVPDEILFKPTAKINISDQLNDLINKFQNSILLGLNLNNDSKVINYYNHIPIYNSVNEIVDTLTDALCNLYESSDAELLAKEVIIFINLNGDNNQIPQGKSAHIDFLIFSSKDELCSKGITHYITALFNKADILNIRFLTTDKKFDRSYTKNQKDILTNDLNSLLKTTTFADIHRLRFMFSDTFKKYQNNQADSLTLVIIGNLAENYKNIYKFRKPERHDKINIALSISPDSFLNVFKNVLQDYFNFETINCY